MTKKISESKQKILSTAINLIKERGYDSVTLNDICTAADIAKNTFYYHFKSKEDLLIQYYEVPLERVTQNFASIILEENNIEKYWKLVEPLLDFIVENGVEITKHMIYALTNQHIPPFIPSEFQKDENDIGAAIIAKAQSSGIIRNTCDPLLLSNVVEAQILGVTLLWCTKNGEFDLKNSIRLTIEICLDIKPELRKASTDSLFNI